MPVTLGQEPSQAARVEEKDQDASQDSREGGNGSNSNLKALEEGGDTQEPLSLSEMEGPESRTTRSTHLGSYDSGKSVSFPKPRTEEGVNASISSSTETDIVAGTSGSAAQPPAEHHSAAHSHDSPLTGHPVAKRTHSPPRVSHDWPVPSTSPKLPALLLRMAPAANGWDIPTPSPPPSFPPSTSSHRLPLRPTGASWVASDLLSQARASRDVYVAPRLPSPRRYGERYNNAGERRHDRSPIRSGREESREIPGWGEEASRKRMQTSSWREEHLPPKRQRSDTAGFREERHGYRHEGRYVRPRDMASRSDEEPRRRYQDTAHHQHQHHLRRESSAEGRRPRDGRAPSEERRGWHDTDRRDDRRLRADVDEGRGTRSDANGVNSTNMNDRSTRSIKRGEDARDSISDRSSRDGHRNSAAEEQYGRRSGDTGRVHGIREPEKVRNHPTRPDNGDGRDERHPHTDDRSRESAADTKERERSSGKEYEGGKAQSTRSFRDRVGTNDFSSRNPVSANGNAQHQDLKSSTQTSSNHPTQSNAFGPRPLPYPRPGAITTSRSPRAIPQPLSLYRGVSASSTRSATSGSNSEPITARRGFELPASSSPASTQSPLKAPRDTLSPPYQDKDYIIATYAALINMVKPVWIENPKAPVANFLTGGKGGANGLGPRGPAYRITSGRLEGKLITRATLPIVGHPSILGVGDDPNRFQAEKLACLSALFQLVKAGLMKAEEQPAAEPVEKQESADVDDVDSEEVTQLSTGETITLREARSFMDYYCKRFGFGEPKISYETVAMRAGPQKWEAIMEVGGKKIGLGAGTTKKMATRVCFLDVTSYLESCDQVLWKEYSSHVKAQGN